MPAPKQSSKNHKEAGTQGSRSGYKRRRLTLRAGEQSPLQQATSLPTHDEGEEPVGTTIESKSGALRDTEHDDEDESGNDMSSGDESSDSEDEGSSRSSSSSSSSSDSEAEEEHHDWDAQGQPHVERKPFIASVFDGKLASIVICEECKHGQCSLDGASGSANEKSSQLTRTRLPQFPRQLKNSWIYPFLCATMLATDSEK